jgi:hypothetical protein
LARQITGFILRFYYKTPSCVMASIAKLRVGEHRQAAWWRISQAVASIAGNINSIIYNLGFPLDRLGWTKLDWVGLGSWYI